MLIVSAIMFASIFIGAIRHKSAYGIIIMLCAIILKFNSEVSTDLWWSSLLFMIIGGVIFAFNLKSEKKEL